MTRSTVFLDRDGVLNRERGEHTWTLDAFEVLPGVPEALHALKQRGWYLVVITNQSGVGLGLYGHKEVSVVHDHLAQVLARQGVALDLVLYCPHHPSKGRCLCRKPGGLLLEKAIARLGLDAASSVMIGDRDRDMEAARSVGVHGILVEPNAPLLPVVQQLLIDR